MLDSNIIEKNKLNLSINLESVSHEIIIALAHSQIDSEQHAAEQLILMDADHKLDFLESHFQHRFPIQIKQLRKFAAALSQIDIGLYGICAYCESEIGEERLNKYPETQRCKTCVKKLN